MKVSTTSVAHAIGMVENDGVINGKNTTVGDQIIGLASGGVHSNGFTFVQKIVTKSGAFQLQDFAQVFTKQFYL